MSLIGLVSVNSNSFKPREVLVSGKTAVHSYENMSDDWCSHLT